MNKVMFSIVALTSIASAQSTNQRAIIMPWAPLFISISNNSEVYWRWVYQNNNIWIEFNNKSKHRVYFNYYLLGLENISHSALNQRISLAGNNDPISPVTIQIPKLANIALPSIPIPVDIRIGDSDEGRFISTMHN